MIDDAVAAAYPPVSEDVRRKHGMTLESAIRAALAELVRQGWLILPPEANPYPPGFNPVVRLR